MHAVGCVAERSWVINTQEGGFKGVVKEVRKVKSRVQALTCSRCASVACTCSLDSTSRTRCSTAAASCGV